MPAIFLCYRRSDTGGVAGRLYDRLSAKYSEAEVFRDIDDIPGGVNFVEASERALANAKTFLALIGESWLGATGKQRLAKRDDRVRVEIELAMRLRVPILPVLVDGAKMPGAAELPKTMADFAYFNARPLDSHSFDYHTSEIIQSLELMIGAGLAEASTPPTPQLFTQPPAPPLPNLAQLIPGAWQLQIHYPNGMMGQAGAQFAPNGQFMIQGVGGHPFEIQGMWQVDPTGSLLLNGQQTDGFRAMPYQAAIRFNQMSPHQLQGAANTGEQATWTRVG